MALSENYFKSRDVRVFPSSFRGTYNNTTTFDPEARLNTEANFIAPKISGNKASYIVNYNTDTIKFVLGGYYFEINNLTDYNLNDSYLNIKLRGITIDENQIDTNKDSERKTFLLDTWEANSDHILDVVDTDDSISYFSGLKISSSPESTAYASIKLFDDKGNINQEAILVKLDHGTGENTLLHGEGLKAGTINQTVFGTYNDNKAASLFEVGKGSVNGESESRINALEISNTTTTINNTTNINGNTTITGSTKIAGTTEIEGTTEITNNTEIKGDLIISKDTESESTTTGALKVAGGVGVSKKLNVGGDTNLTNKVIIKAAPADTETNVKVDGTLNVTGKTDIYSNVTVESEKTTLAKPVEITDASDTALTVKGKTTIEKDLEVGSDTKVLAVKNSPSTGEQNVTITGTLKSTGKATFENGLEVASGKTTTLGGQVDITGAVNINTSNQDDPGDVTIYGDTTINGDTSIEGTTEIDGTTSIIGTTSITGNINIDGKATSTYTDYTDEDTTTLTTKNYVDSKITALEVASVGGDGKYLKTISETDGKITATSQSFDTTISDNSTDTNAPTSKAVYDHVNNCLSELSFTEDSIEDADNGSSYICAITQTNGQVSAKKKDAVTTFTDDTTTNNQTIPTTTGVVNYVNNKLRTFSRPVEAFADTTMEYDDEEYRRIISWAKEDGTRHDVDAAQNKGGVMSINYSDARSKSTKMGKLEGVNIKLSALPDVAWDDDSRYYWFSSGLSPLGAFQKYLESTTIESKTYDLYEVSGSYLISFWLRFFKDDSNNNYSAWEKDDSGLRIDLIKLLYYRLTLDDKYNIFVKTTDNKYELLKFTEADTHDKRVRKFDAARGNNSLKVKLKSIVGTVVEPRTDNYPDECWAVYGVPFIDEYNRYAYVTRSSTSDRFWGCTLQIIADVTFIIGEKVE